MRPYAVLVVALLACGSAHRDPVDDDLPDRDVTVVLTERARAAAARDRADEATARALAAITDNQREIEALTRTLDGGATTLDALQQAQVSADRAEANARLADLQRRRADLVKMLEQDRVLERYRRRMKLTPSVSIY
jgi:hypothetical protein